MALCSRGCVPLGVLSPPFPVLFCSPDCPCSWTADLRLGVRLQSEERDCSPGDFSAWAPFSLSLTRSVLSVTASRTPALSGLWEQTPYLSSFRLEGDHGFCSCYSLGVPPCRLLPSVTHASQRSPFIAFCLLKTLEWNAISC